jgi:hypothetical protein
MPITTDKNTSYGPPFVNTKYSPLMNIEYVNDNRALHSWILTNRSNLFAQRNLLPGALRLATANWNGIIVAEAGHLPPLVVISSCRSGWIADGVAAATAQLTALGQAHFASVTDLNALTAYGADQTCSPPIYCPARLGPNPNRNVYIVVHITEYETYVAALAGSGMTVIGWVFAAPLNQHDIWLAGFGASRFAAIEFCKTLRTAATPQSGAAPWNYAWLFDDNVVALNNLPGLANIEAMTIPSKTSICWSRRTSTRRSRLPLAFRWRAAHWRSRRRRYRTKARSTA